jgi:hypothetical protein
LSSSQTEGIAAPELDEPDGAFATEVLRGVLRGKQVRCDDREGYL